MKNQVLNLKNRVANIQAIANLEAHPATRCIPSMTEAERIALKADIKGKGQRDSIKVVEGMIIDGRERYRVCRELGISPKVEFIDLPEGMTATDLVMGFNFHRRNLTESQRAIIAASMSNTKVGSNQTSKGVITQGEAAAIYGVSRDSLIRAKKVLDSGNQSLIRAVLEGRLDVSNACRILSDAGNVRRDFSKTSGAGLTQVAKAAVKEKNDEKRRGTMEQVEMARAANKPLKPNGKRYGLVYADPPWKYLPESETRYPLDHLQVICAEFDHKLAEENAVLALWVPPSQIEAGMAVVKAWGFEFKTSMVWDKERTGTGQYFMNQHEYLFIATRGKPLRPCKRFSSVLRDKRATKHSKKPIGAYALLEDMYEGLSKLEMYARDIREGWDGWGNQYPGNQPVGVKPPKNLAKAATPKVVNGKAANDAKAKPATASKQGKSVRVANDATFKKAA